MKGIVIMQDNDNTAEIAVRIWWGYKQPALSPDQFRQQLGELFIPVTVIQQAPLGLTAYLPAIMPALPHSSVPDEVAIVFYESRPVYEATKGTVNGREYQALHRAVFNFAEPCASHSDFPVPMAETLATGQSQVLLSEAGADWQSGTAKFFCGVPEDGQSLDDFLERAGAVMKLIQSQPAPDLDGAIVRISNNCLTYWEHHGQPGSSDDTNLDRLSRVCKMVMRRSMATPVAVPMSGNSPFAGIRVVEGSFFCLRFPLRQEEDHR